MKTNLPIYPNEYEYPADATLMSTTDTQSRITYANAAFIQVSGFERDEIAGEMHNVVRHPDMPRQAFADMWKTLKAGKSWTALVKTGARTAGITGCAPMPRRSFELARSRGTCLFAPAQAQKRSARPNRCTASSVSKPRVTRPSIKA